MKKYSILFSEHEKGWKMAVVPSFMQERTYDDLIAWAAAEAKARNLKGFLVSENPCPFPMKKD